MTWVALVVGAGSGAEGTLGSSVAAGANGMREASEVHAIDGAPIAHAASPITPRREVVFRAERFIVVDREPPATPEKSLAPRGTSDPW